MTKVININGQRFALPEGMSAKDIQALGGFLLALLPLEQDYDYDKREYMHSLSDRSAQVQLENVELADRAEAKAQSTSSYERYQVKREAEKQASAG